MSQENTYEELKQRVKMLEEEVEANRSAARSLEDLEKCLERQKAYRSAMHETAVGLLQRTDLDELLQTIVSRACALAGTEHGYLHLYDPGTDELVLKIGLGRLKPAVDFRLKPGEGLAGKIWQNQEIMVVDDYARWSERESDPRFDHLRSIVGVPLKSDTQVVGALGLAHFEPPLKFDDDAIEILGQFAEIATLVLKNTINHADLGDELGQRERVEIALKRRLDFERIVAMVSSRFVASADASADINASLADIGRLSGKSRAYLFLFDRQHQTMSNTHEWCAEGVHPQIKRLQNLTLTVPSWTVAKILKGETVEIEDVAKMPPEAIKTKKVFEMQKIKSLIMVPLKIGDHIEGFIGFDDVHKTGPWSADDVALLEVVSNIIGSALEREHTEQALADEKERLAITLRSIGDGVITTDIDGKITLLNSVAEKLTGWPQQEAIGRPLAEVCNIVNEFTRIPCENPVQKVIDTGKIVELANHTLLTSRDGTEYIIADSAAPITGADGQKLGVVLVFRNVTEKRKMEVELQKIQKLESLGVLAGGIAHDFNNFLTGIIGYISLAKIDAGSGGSILTQLNEMEKASHRAQELTQQLLTFAKGGEPVKKVQDITALIREAATFALRGSKIRCEFRLPEDLWLAEVDAGQIAQVINNLILNADQSMPQGGVVTVAADNAVLAQPNNLSLPAGKYVNVSIQDQGSGISADHLPNIFDPYFTSKQKGSGLGLTVAYSIVDKHNGRLTVTSKLGEGSDFSLYLPAARDNACPEFQEESPLRFGRGRILIMDDEAIIRDVAKGMLKKLGYDVVLASDGDEAIDVYRKARQAGVSFDAVILDLTVRGGTGGKAAIERLRNLDANVNALVSSGYSNDPVMSNPENYGFNGVLTKPYRIQQMSDALHKLLDRDGANR